MCPPRGLFSAIDWERVLEEVERRRTACDRAAKSRRARRTPMAARGTLRQKGLFSGQNQQSPSPANLLIMPSPAFSLALILLVRPRWKCIGDITKGRRRGRCQGLKAQVLCICLSGCRQQKAEAVATVSEQQPRQEGWLRCRCQLASSDQECPAVYGPCFTYRFVFHRHPE